MTKSRYASRVNYHLNQIDDININDAEYKQRVTGEIKKVYVVYGNRIRKLTDKQRMYLLRLAKKIRADSWDACYKFWKTKAFEWLKANAKEP